MEFNLPSSTVGSSTSVDLKLNIVIEGEGTDLDTAKTLIQ